MTKTNEEILSGMRELAGKEFSEDKLTFALAQKGIDYTEEWSIRNGYVASDNLSEEELDKQKTDCEDYVSAKLKEEREKNYGIIGAFIGAVIFSVCVQLVVRWIIKNFFTDQA